MHRFQPQMVKKGAIRGADKIWEEKDLNLGKGKI